jgi:formylglycine-generating enzyme required for sulfatase activity
MTQPGADAITGWGQLLQGLKALEPKVVPVEAAKISAQDRAAIAAVEQARKQQKRSLYTNIASVISIFLLLGFIAWKVWGTNERTLDDQVHIPEGEFLFANGEPTTLPEFWIDKYEVTYGQYAKFVQFLETHPTSEYDDPRQPPRKTSAMHTPENWPIFYGQAKVNGKARSVPIDLNCPVMEVDWWDAYAYAKWKGRELPSEKEWEKAARGTKGFLYPWGDEFDPKKVNSNKDFDPNHPGARGAVDGFNFWNPVDAIKGDKSPFGVIGMAGNVREWTGTWDAQNKHPIIKGGSYMSTDVRLDQRTDTFEPAYYNESLGFRTISHTAPAKK